jgi:hypothetical protein
MSRRPRFYSPILKCVARHPYLSPMIQFPYLTKRNHLGFRYRHTAARHISRYREHRSARPVSGA